MAKSYRASTILELTVSLGIIAIIIVLFSNLLVSTLSNSLKIAGRSAVREELSRVASLIRRDVRTAQEIVSCGDPAVPASLDVCTLRIGGSLYRWQACPGAATKVCKLNEAGTTVLSTSTNFTLNSLSFDSGVEESSSGLLKRNVLLTIVASHPATSLKVNNLVFQATISSRNYDLVFSSPI